MYDPVKVAAENGFRLQQFAEGRWACQIGNHRTYSISARDALVTELNRLGSKKVIANGKLVPARELADRLLSLPVAISATEETPAPAVQGDEPLPEGTPEGSTLVDFRKLREDIDGG